VDVPANQVPRGIVTIQDVATDPDLTVAAN
jgi:hypothetical protein